MRFINTLAPSLPCASKEPFDYCAVFPTGRSLLKLPTGIAQVLIARDPLDRLAIIAGL